VTAPALHPGELGRTLVELVVADGVEVEPDLVHGLDRRLVVEERRQQRRGADQVTGGYDHRVAVVGREVAHVRGEVLGPTGRNARGAGIGSDRAGRGGFEVPVEVVEPDQLDLHVLGHARGRQGEHDDEGGQEQSSRAHAPSFPSSARHTSPGCFHAVNVL